MKRSSPRLCAAAFAMVVLLGACAEDQARGDAITEVGSETEDSSSTTSSTPSDETSTTTEPSTSTSDASTTSEPTPTTETPTTASIVTTTTTPTTTAPEVPEGLPTPDDVAYQVDTHCLQTDTRDLAERWFEPGVLDDLNCRQDDGSGTPSRALTEFYGPCEAIPNAAGDASHRCFFGYEGGGYSLLVGDLGRGYRGLAVTYVVD